MTIAQYGLQHVSSELLRTLTQYLEAQYHIWDEYLVGERRRLLEAPGVIHREPYIEATPSYVPGKPFSELRIPPQVKELLNRAALAANSGIPATPYKHQAEALEAFFHAEKPDLVISTGTGSGKTESFLMPILGSLALERSLRPASYAQTGMRALLLYPMNALVNDQVARLRRLLGSPSVAELLTRPDGYRACFGMYTSRTPYPGPGIPARTKRDVGGWIDKFFLAYQAKKSRLESEGKWPAKDLAAFRKTFTTSPTDSELITRQEMQERTPDVLVTNYSMLEYMLLRPVDSPIFDRTTKWLADDPDNKLIVVLDEAHLYQGAQGTEVALLLRRLVSRLRVPRNRIRFIMTSASLAAGPDSQEVIRTFAAQLTGGSAAGTHFQVIRGELDIAPSNQPGTSVEANAFAVLDVDKLYSADTDLEAAVQAAKTLALNLGSQLPNTVATSEELRTFVYSLLEETPVARMLSATIMGRPTSHSELGPMIFPSANEAAASLDGLLAATAFARRARDGKVYLPSRAHLLFRGLEGVYACTNVNCSARPDVSRPTLLGRLYSKPRLTCDCGSRVFELLTHRDCGAAFLRAYFRADSPDFLWHEASTGLATPGQALSTVHLLVEHGRDQLGTSNQVWLHTQTGQLERLRPHTLTKYLELRSPTTTPVSIAGRPVVTFDRRCPVCKRGWQHRDKPKIMDLATKGEDPFAHLIAAQIRLQAPTSLKTTQSPNAGRKSLLFSDGRQKAARLARDVPRVIDNDAFRQVILLAARTLISTYDEARLSDSFLYAGFVDATSREFLHFFDGADAEGLHSDEGTLRRLYGGSLTDAMQDPWQPQAPMGFRVNLMKALGSRNYSVYALGLGYVAPRQMVLRRLRQSLAPLGLSDPEVDALCIVWIQRHLEQMALYAVPPRTHVTRRSREIAAGHSMDAAGTRSGFTLDQRRRFTSMFDVEAFERELRSFLATPGDASDLHVLDDGALVLVPAVDRHWYRCKDCTHLSPVTWRSSCVACGGMHLLEAPPGGDIYLRARKAFWRDPVEQVLSGASSPMTLAVEEHTAQLGYRDTDDLEATTESFERRFRDILIDGERSIDVLSCTTTMEVGIDIGSLIAVGLRNMPPSRHNYQQRAGRAGRRGSAVSTVVCYGQNNPHDSFLFDNPSELIAGQPKLTGLDIDNPTLIRRHVFAELIQEFFDCTVVGREQSNVFAVLGETSRFFSEEVDGTLISLMEWISASSDAAETVARIENWLPQGSGLNAAACATELLIRLGELSTIGRSPLPPGEEKLIEFLFARGILPAYAFPRDLVAIQVDQRDSTTGNIKIIERAQQSASVALSEYAPGRLVVINKKTYRVAAVTAATTADTIDRAFPLFRNPPKYVQCSNCLYTASPESASSGSTCPVCAGAILKLITAVQPEVVWPFKGVEVDELDDDQVFTDTTLAQLPVPASDLAFDTQEPFGPRAQLRHGRLVPLVILNRGEVSGGVPAGFQVCEKCGSTTNGGAPFPIPHDRHYNLPRRGGPVTSRCSGSPVECYLGYEFRTDVLLLHIPIEAPFICDLLARETWPPLRAALASLANGLALTAASELDIDPRELQCGYRLQRNASGAAIADIYLYDTLSGGAGYSRLIGNHFSRVFGETIRRLNECTCTQSCTKCLRTYGNRMYHASLDRRLALDLAAYIQSGEVPRLYTPTQQREILIPVTSMLELDGWVVRPSDSHGLSISRKGKSADIAVLPSLFDPGSRPDEWAACICLSTFDIEMDLPSCLLEMPT